MIVLEKPSKAGLEIELFYMLSKSYNMYKNSPGFEMNIKNSNYHFQSINLAEWLSNGRVVSQEALLNFYKDVLNFYLEELVAPTTRDYDKLYQYQETLDYIRKYAEERNIDLFGEKSKGYTDEWYTEVMKGYHIINLLKRDGSYTMLWQKMTAEDFLTGEYGRHHWTTDVLRKLSNKLKNHILGTSPFHKRLQKYTGTRAEALIKMRRIIDQVMMTMNMDSWSDNCLVIARDVLERVARENFDGDIAEAYIDEVWLDWRIDDSTGDDDLDYLEEALIGRRQELDYQAAFGVEEWLEAYFGDLLNRFNNLENDPRSRWFTIFLELFPDFAFYLMLGDIEVDPFEYLGVSASTTDSLINCPSP